MTYLQKNKKRNFGLYSYIAIFLIIIILFFSRPLFNWIGLQFGKLAYSTSGITGNIFYRTFGLIYSKETLMDKVDELSLYKNKANALEFKIKSLEEENIDLSEKLGRMKEGRRFVLAYVIAGPVQSLYDSLLIDLGRNANIKEGDMVKVENIYIGNISEVFSSNAKVELLSSPSKTFEIRIGNSNIIATAYGRGSGNFFARLPRESDVKEGDTVYLQDNEPFAVVESIELNPSDSFQKIFFKLPVNVFEIKEVEVYK